ncbi:MAG TPA: ATPase [Bacillota bacterium]|nr:ATPase [Bacillota bacterium]HQC36162.1 ATPase [Bacillota bacterium]
MKVLELLDELEEIMAASSAVPLLKKVMVDPDEITEIVREIRLELPDEIQQAQWIKNERARILEDAKAEYEGILDEAQIKADKMVEHDEITIKAKQKSEDILANARDYAQITMMESLDYSDQILNALQQKMDMIYGSYFTDMYGELQATFDKISNNLSFSRNEIKDKIYRIQAEKNEQR